MVHRHDVPLDSMPSRTQRVDASLPHRRSHLRTNRRSGRAPAASLSAAAAYRMDVEKRKSAFGPHEGAGIVVGTMVGQVALARGPDRRRLLDEAATLASGFIESSSCVNDPPYVDRS